jgi:hypothetical protein
MNSNGLATDLYVIKSSFGVNRWPVDAVIDDVKNLIISGDRKG